MSAKMSIDIWLKELDKIYVNNETDGISINEFAKYLNIGLTKAKMQMKILIDENKWACIGRRNKIGIDGRNCTCPVYAPIKGKNNDKK